MTFLDICDYCSSMGDRSEKPVTIWKETGERVCYDCRVEFVEQEFEDSSPRNTIPADIKEAIELGLPF